MSHPRLKIYIDSDDKELTEKYKVSAGIHNSNLTNKIYHDAGFDIFQPYNVELFQKNYGYIQDMKIVCEMYQPYTSQTTGLSKKPMSFYLYPRSSISKTYLRLANSVGIIDSGYRGHIKCAFDILKNTKIYKYDRLVQVCHPSLKPFRVEIVDDISKFEKTERDDKGFGSSGK